MGHQKYLLSEQIFADVDLDFEHWRAVVTSDSDIFLTIGRYFS